MTKQQQQIRQLITKVGGTIPADFEPTTESRMHPNLQLFLATDWNRQSYKGAYRLDMWMIQFLNFGINDNCLEIAHADGGNYTIVIEDFEDENPAVLGYDHEEPDRHFRLTYDFISFLEGLELEH